nr:unnamed protein product [Callosobruchus analis]
MFVVCDGSECCRFSLRYWPTVSLETSELASQSVLVGYSLVGVYPCAVWKPESQIVSVSNNQPPPTTVDPGPVHPARRTNPRPAPQTNRLQQCQIWPASLPLSCW